MRLSRVSAAFDARAAAEHTIEPGQRAVFETRDARDGALLQHAPGRSFDLPRPTPGLSNPLTGPLVIAGAVPGDRLVVDVEEIELLPLGWCGAHAHVGPLPPGRVDRPLCRVCEIDDHGVNFGDGIRVGLTPMVGCLGVAPEGPASGSAAASRHGGNLDHRPLGAGARVHLPVFVESALLWLGDVHAAQGDGELSGVALECPARVRVRVELQRGDAPSWPWIETSDRVMVLTSGASFEEARHHAVEAATAALESQLGLAAAEAMALLSVAGDLRVGQAFGGPELTLRLELPANLGVRPA